jgi:hypothetical protein
MLREIGARALAATGESTLRAVDYMDDGSKINLKISIDVDEGKAGNYPLFFSNFNLKLSI